MLRLRSEPGWGRELEHRLRWHDGAERGAATKANADEPLGEGGVWRGTTMDITDRKRAESTLQTEHHVTRILAAGGEDDSVLPALLKVLCTRLNMVCAVQWLADGAHALRCERVWCTIKGRWRRTPSSSWRRTMRSPGCPTGSNFRTSSRPR